MKSFKILLTLVCVFFVLTTKAQNGNLPSNVNQNEVYCLSMLSNIPAQTVGAKTYLNTIPAIRRMDSIKSIAKIVDYATPIIKKCLQNAVDSTSSNTKISLNNWSLFWGPGVIPTPSYIIDTKGDGDYYVSTVSMSIFQNKTTNTFVVAVQATNPNSLYAWSTLDFNVSTTQPWDDTTSHGVITNGTYLGLNYLKNLTNKDLYNGIQALLSACNSNSNVVVTGHSLGGALSPVLALYLQNTYSKIAGNVYCLSTAGATPGDATFAQYYNSKLGANTVRIWNNFDVIPHAWNTNILQSMQSNKNGNKIDTGGIYSLPGGSVFYDSAYLKCDKNKAQPSKFDSMPTPAYINSLINWAIGKTGSTTYTPICNGGMSFMGAAANSNTTNYYIDVNPLNKAELDAIQYVYKLVTFGDTLHITDGYFLPEMAAQHVDAYTYEFQMKQIHEYIRNQIEGNPQSVVNMCGIFSALNDSMLNLLKPKPSSKNSINPYAYLQALVYKRAWRL